MTNTDTSLFFSIYGWLGGAALCFARLAPVFYMVPFLNSNVLVGLVRTAVILLTGLALWPNAPQAVLTLDHASYLALALHEGVIGTLLGVLIAWPFWVFQALGAFIDNQRGATLSSSIDPANGIETSELANFFTLFSAVIYLQGGGLVLILEVLSRSYELCHPLGPCTPHWSALFNMINMIAAKAIILASPVVAAMLLSEVILGLLSRFAAQLNAFSVSLTVKSIIAFIVVLIYFTPVLPRAIMDMALHPSGLTSWFISNSKSN